MNGACISTLLRELYTYAYVEAVVGAGKSDYFLSLLDGRTSRKEKHQEGKKEQLESVGWKVAAASH